MSRWTAAEIPPQSGRTIIVTGATSGVGRVAAAELAAHGARVVLAVRDLDRGRRAAAEMAGPVEVLRLDLADLSSVRTFADGWSDPVDVLVNNAGVMAVPEGRTVDGFEIQVGTNHLGHFALTNLLLPLITDRVVTVASGAHRMGRVDVADLNWERRRYSAWRAYGQSKLANLLFTLELQRRLTADGSVVRALASHPGLAATNLQGKTGHRMADRLTQVVTKIVGQSDGMGALPTLYAAVEDIPGGSYVGPDGRAEQRGYPTLVGRSAEASDVRSAMELWLESERLTGVSYPILSR